MIYCVCACIGSHTCGRIEIEDNTYCTACEQLVGTPHDCESQKATTVHEHSGFYGLSHCGKPDCTFPKDDPVNHPPHYKRGGMETIDYLTAHFGYKWMIPVVIQYLDRAGHKGDELEDLKKAQVYIGRIVEEAKKAGS